MVRERFSPHVHSATAKRQLNPFLQKSQVLYKFCTPNYLESLQIKNFRPFFWGNDAISNFPIHHGESVPAQCPDRVTGFVDATQLTDFLICALFAHFFLRCHFSRIF